MSFIIISIYGRIECHSLLYPYMDESNVVHYYVHKWTNRMSFIIMSIYGRSNVVHCYILYSHPDASSTFIGEGRNFGLGPMEDDINFNKYSPPTKRYFQPISSEMNIESFCRVKVTELL